jgi:hypothetical protein
VAFWKDPAKNRLPNGTSFAYVVTRVTETVEKINTHHNRKDNDIRGSRNFLVPGPKMPIVLMDYYTSLASI